MKSKVCREDPIISAAFDKIKSYIQEDEDRLVDFYGLLLACSKLLGDFILENHDVNNLPRDIQYYLAQTWNSYATVFKKDKIQGFHDLDFQDYFESGGLDDRFAIVVKALYEVCKKEKLL